MQQIHILNMKFDPFRDIYYPLNKTNYSTAFITENFID